MKPSLHKQRLGKLGEDFACSFLKKKGFRILERNFRKRYGELDIVALYGKILVFVEVKTRVGYEFGTPEEAVTPWKLREVVRMAQFYKSLHPELPESLRIDVIGVVLDDFGTLERITHTPNVTF